MCNLLAKYQEMISLAHSVLLDKRGKSVTSYVLININELVPVGKKKLQARCSIRFCTPQKVCGDAKYDRGS